ncbi:MAG TPA: (5-formylfuran-3-yl)methyl phosphate synthase [Lacipirellula sp.]
MNEAPQLLISVRNAEEAAAALVGGADWIDLKEPDRGALGAVDASVAQDVVACIDGRASISAAGGELRDWTDGSARSLLEIGGIQVLKLGLSGLRDRPWQNEWLAAKREIEAAGKELAAVVYADEAAAASPPWNEILHMASDSACRWILIDTFDKQARSIFDCTSDSELRQLFESARRGGCTVVAAGRLDLTAISRLPVHLLNIVGVRGAACEGGRSGAVCRRRVAELRAVLSGCAMI